VFVCGAQIDCDEIWSADGIVRAFKAVVDDKRACLKVRCSFFVGEGRTIAFNGGWGDGPGEWLRVWRSYPGDYFASHAPPVLVTTRDNQLQSVAVDHSECADKDEMWEKGIFFDHYAYVREEQVQFKAKFYGYGAEAVEGWRRLQTATLPARANGYLKWLNEGEKNYEPRFDDTTVVQMLGEKIEVKNWPATVPCRHTIVIDCVTFQVNDGGGIARVWKEALPRLVEKVSSERASKPASCTLGAKKSALQGCRSTGYAFPKPCTHPILAGRERRYLLCTGREGTECRV